MPTPCAPASFARTLNGDEYVAIPSERDGEDADWLSEDGKECKDQPLSGKSTLKELKKYKEKAM